MRGGHKSGSPQEGFDALAQGEVVFKLIEQNELVEKDGTEHDETEEAYAY